MTSLFWISVGWVVMALLLALAAEGDRRLTDACVRILSIQAVLTIWYLLWLLNRSAGDVRWFPWGR